MQKDIIKTLIIQHKGLVKDITKVAEIMEKNEKDHSQEIVANLNIFKDHLLKHLKLENEVFYIELLKAMKQEGIKTELTEAFINEMTALQKVVLGFLDKYTAQIISQDFNNFKLDFEKIKQALALRIESEEEGVYVSAKSYLQLE